MEEYRKTHEITIVQEADKVGNPITNFLESGFPDYIMQAFQAENFTEPTPIQAQGWPIALKGIMSPLNGFSW